MSGIPEFRPTEGAGKAYGPPEAKVNNPLDLIPASLIPMGESQKSVKAHKRSFPPGTLDATAAIRRTPDKINIDIQFKGNKISMEIGVVKDDIVNIKVWKNGSPLAVYTGKLKMGEGNEIVAQLGKDGKKTVTITPTGEDSFEVTNNCFAKSVLLVFKPIAQA